MKLANLGWFLVLCGLVVAGCGGTTSVKGTVKVDGQPLTSGSVAFHPEGSKGESETVVGRSEIDASGNYNLMTNGKQGVPAGKYKVVVIATAPSDANDPYSLPKSLVDPKYTQIESTPLTVEVGPGTSPDAYNLVVTK